MSNRLKSLKKILFICVLIFIIWSCKKDVLLEVSDYEYKSNKTALIEVNIQTITGKTEVANNINQELCDFVCTTFYIDASKDTQHKIADCANQFNDSYSNFKSQFSSELSQELPKWEAFVDGELSYQNEVILSFAMSSSINTGGSQPITKVKFLNFNRKSGKLLSFNDLVSNNTALLAVIKPYLEKELFSSTLTIEEFTTNNLLNIPDHFGYNDLGVVIIYQTPTNNFIEFSVPFNKLENYLNY